MIRLFEKVSKKLDVRISDSNCIRLVLWVSYNIQRVSSRVHNCAMKYRQLITTCKGTTWSEKLMTLSTYGEPKLRASVFSRVRNCAIKYRQLVTTCTGAKGLFTIYVAPFWPQFDTLPQCQNDQFTYHMHHNVTKMKVIVVYMFFFCGIDSTWDASTWRHFPFI